MSEFEMQTNEAIGMVRGGQQLPRVACHFIPEAEYRYLKRLEREDMDREAQAERNAWKDRLMQTGAAVIRAGCGILFIAAAAEGLMDHTFAAILTGTCMAWGLGGFFWGRKNG